MSPEDRIAAALAEMDRSMYGDPEVPFRMRAILEARDTEAPPNKRTVRVKRMVGRRVFYEDVEVDMDSPLQ